jgi:hypothetical protein
MKLHERTPIHSGLSSDIEFARGHHGLKVFNMACKMNRTNKSLLKQMDIQTMNP